MKLCYSIEEAIRRLSVGAVKITGGVFGICWNLNIRTVRSKQSIPLVHPVLIGMLYKKGKQRRKSKFIDFLPLLDKS